MNFRNRQELNQFDEKVSIIQQQNYQDKAGKQVLTIKGPKTMMTIMLMGEMMRSLDDNNHFDDDNDG